MKYTVNYCLSAFTCFVCFLLFLLFMLVNFPVHAAVYKQVDSEGRVTFTDQPDTNAKEVNMKSGEVEATKAPMPAPRKTESKITIQETSTPSETGAATVEVETFETGTTRVPVNAVPANVAPASGTTENTMPVTVTPVPATGAPVNAISTSPPTITAPPSLIPANATSTPLPTVTPIDSGSNTNTTNTNLKTNQNQPKPKPIMPPPKKKPPIYSISLFSPAEDQTFQNGEDVIVKVGVMPQLEVGDNIVVYVDGAPATEPTNDTSIMVPRLDRGSHTVQARIIQPNGTGAETQIVNIFQQRTSVLLPPNRIGP